jgi:hypothetical protein
MESQRNHGFVKSSDFLLGANERLAMNAKASGVIVFGPGKSDAERRMDTARDTDCRDHFRKRSMITEYSSAS